MAFLSAKNMSVTIHLPKDLIYTLDHEWLRRTGTESLVGITAFAVRELGDIVFLDLPKPGTVFRQGQVFGSVEAVKTVSDLVMPVSGIVIEVNALVLKVPELVNSAPYDEGWLIRIFPSDKSELENLLNAAEYGEIIG